MRPHAKWGIWGTQNWVVAKLDSNWIGLILTPILKSDGFESPDPRNSRSNYLLRTTKYNE